MDLLESIAGAGVPTAIMAYWAKAFWDALQAERAARAQDALAAKAREDALLNRFLGYLGAGPEEDP